MTTKKEELSLWGVLFPGKQVVPMEDFINDFCTFLKNQYPSDIPSQVSARPLLLAARIHNKDFELTCVAFEDFVILFGPIR